MAVDARKEEVVAKGKGHARKTGEETSGSILGYANYWPIRFPAVEGPILSSVNLFLSNIERFNWKHT